MSGSDVDVDTRLPKHRVTRTVGCKIGWNCILVLDDPIKDIKKGSRKLEQFSALLITDDVTCSAPSG